MEILQKSKTKRARENVDCAVFGYQCRVGWSESLQMLALTGYSNFISLAVMEYPYQKQLRRQSLF